MEDFIKVLKENFTLCEKLNEKLQGLLGVTSESMPLAGLNMAHQKAVGAYEPATFYYAEWGIPHPVTETQLAIILEDNSLRLMALARACFIETMSAFEYCLKETVKMHPGVITLPPKKRIYLYDIMIASRDAGLFTEKEFASWDGLRVLRNSLVHNNAIADHDAVFEFNNEIPDDLLETISLVMTEGQAQKSKLTLLPLLCQWAIYAYARWSIAYFRRLPT